MVQIPCLGILLDPNHVFLCWPLLLQPSIIRGVSFAYTRWLMFLPSILIPAQHFSWCAQLVSLINRATKKSLVPLSRSWTSQSFHRVLTYFLTCIQVSQDTGKMVWYSHLFKRVPQFVMSHTVKGFSVVDETEVDVFLEFPCFLYNLANVGNFFSNSFFFKPSLDIWKFLVHVILKLSL